LFDLCLLVVCSKRVVLLLLVAAPGHCASWPLAPTPGPQKSLGFDRAEVLRKFCANLIEPYLVTRPLNMRIDASLCGDIWRQSVANKLLSELEIFRTEEETAQQYFFAYLSVRSMAAENSDVLKMMNMNPLFWVTAHHAMLLSTFVALGRIFDLQSKHNIGT
jgi:hypothetical protein